MNNYEWLKTLSLKEQAKIFSNWREFIANCVSEKKIEEWLKKIKKNF